MSADPLASYLKAHRKLSGLSQTEIAYLLSADSPQTISRLERGNQTPDLPAAFAFEVIFDVPVHELFEGTYADVEMRTQNHAYLLARRIEQLPDDEANRLKLRTLKRVYERALEPDD